MIDLATAFRLVVGSLESVGAEYVVVGSTAAAAWGVARATRDVDLVALIEPESAQALFGRSYRDDLYVHFDDALAAIQDSGTFNVLDPGTGGKVDVFISRSDDAFTRSRLDRRVSAEVLGVRTFIASPEDVVLAKLRWRFESRSEVQWRDCVEIVATQSLDRDYLWSWVNVLGVTDDLGDLLADS